VGVIFFLFGVLAALTWLSIYGYLTVLGGIVALRPKRRTNNTFLPDIAIMVPVLNEENLILSKLSNLEKSDYPGKCVSVMVVDGGSVDRTADIVRKEIAGGKKIQFVSLDKARGKADQVAHALTLLKEEIVVVTDTDARMEASCIRELVSQLGSDPRAAMVGAWVEPQSRLAEERIHWLFLNNLWWLEGEAFSAASLSGVCYICRRSKVMSLSRTAQAEDIHLSLLAGANGFPVHLSRKARARELRVPQTLKQMIRFRRRRGASYLAELRKSATKAASPPGWRLARFMKICHFSVVPKIAVVLVIFSFILLGTGYWPWPLVAFFAFALPLSLFLFSPLFKGEGIHWWKLPLVLSRYFAFTLASLLTLNPDSPHQGPVGGKS
jgi:cellulose synthase/poly-beta-1,6-N-acetylglucosamine synthase-like glycosyltransferase